jgi:hypothetical protein
MMRKVILVAGAIAIAAVLTAAGIGSIDRRPPAADFSLLGQRPFSLARPTTAGDPFAVDLRHHDLSATDLGTAGDVLSGYASWDTATKWPTTLPPGFDPARFLELGKNPGLGLRALHRQGITGKGVRVAFIDQTLLVDHEEYRDRVESYHEIGNVPREAQMHAAAIMSLLAGRTIGVAPEAAVTFYAVDHIAANRSFKWPNHAKAINEILDENAGLPLQRRIRVIGISLGYSPEQEGYAEMTAAVARAKREGVLVLTTTMGADGPIRFMGLGRSPLADPDDPASYGPGMFWAKSYFANPAAWAGIILAPMDARATAGPTGLSDYAYYRVGGLSWVVPYLVGVYALGLQVRPELTPEDFYRAALATGSRVTVVEGGKSFSLGPIINPATLVASLRGN